MMGFTDTFVKRGWRAGQQMTRRGDYHVGLFDPKRSGSRGFHEGIFDEGFGGFSTLKRKRRPEMTSRGIHGDAFTGRRNHATSKPIVEAVSTQSGCFLYLVLVFFAEPKVHFESRFLYPPFCRKWRALLDVAFSCTLLI